MKNLKLVLLITVLLCAVNLFSQEVAPLKTYQYTVGVNHLKSQSQVDNILTKLSQIKGIENCTMVLIDYELNFECTNHDLQKYNIMDVVKQVLGEESAQITVINYKIIESNESK